MFNVFTLFVFTVLALFGGGADKPKKVENHVIETLNADPACFHICGESQAKVNLAKTKLQGLINDQYHSHEIPDNAIQSLSKEDCQSIAAIQRRLGISISTKNNQEVLVICGHRPHVFEACAEINAILRKAKEKRDAELAGLMVAWQYQSHGSKFKNFNQDTTYRLEQALTNQDPQVKVTIEGKQYIVQMPRGPATDNQGGTLEINRIDLTEGILLVSSDWSQRLLKLLKPTQDNPGKKNVTTEFHKVFFTTAIVT